MKEPDDTIEDINCKHDVKSPLAGNDEPVLKTEGISGQEERSGNNMKASRAISKSGSLNEMDGAAPSQSSDNRSLERSPNQTPVKPTTLSLPSKAPSSSNPKQLFLAIDATPLDHSRLNFAKPSFLPGSLELENQLGIENSTDDDGFSLTSSDDESVVLTSEEEDNEDYLKAEVNLPPITTTKTSTTTTKKPDFFKEACDTDDQVPAPANVAPEVSEEELNYLRFKSQFRLKSALDRICEKYGRSFEGIADEIDLETEEVVVDRGCLENCSKKDVGSSSSKAVDESQVAEAWAIPSVREKFIEFHSIENYVDDQEDDLLAGSRNIERKNRIRRDEDEIISYSENSNHENEPWEQTQSSPINERNEKVYIPAYGTPQTRRTRHMLQGHHPHHRKSSTILAIDSMKPSHNNPNTVVHAKGGFFVTQKGQTYSEEDDHHDGDLDDVSSHHRHHHIPPPPRNPLPKRIRRMIPVMERIIYTHQPVIYQQHPQLTPSTFPVYQHSPFYPEQEIIPSADSSSDDDLIN